MFIKYLRPFFFSPQITKYSIFNYGWLKLYFIEIYLISSTYFYLHFNPCHIVVFVPELFWSSQSQKNKIRCANIWEWARFVCIKIFAWVFFSFGSFLWPSNCLLPKITFKGNKNCCQNGLRNFLLNTELCWSIKDFLLFKWIVVLSVVCVVSFLVREEYFICLTMHIYFWPNLQKKIPLKKTTRGTTGWGRGRIKLGIENKKELQKKHLRKISQNVRTNTCTNTCIQLDLQTSICK